jgi:hypothetical protein
MSPLEPNKGVARHRSETAAGPDWKRTDLSSVPTKFSTNGRESDASTLQIERQNLLFALNILPVLASSTAMASGTSSSAPAIVAGISVPRSCTELPHPFFGLFNEGVVSDGYY